MHGNYQPSHHSAKPQLIGPSTRPASYTLCLMRLLLSLRAASVLLQISRYVCVSMLCRLINIKLPPPGLLPYGYWGSHSHAAAIVYAVTSCRSHNLHNLLLSSMALGGRSWRNMMSWALPPLCHCCKQYRHFSRQCAQKHTETIHVDFI